LSRMLQASTSRREAGASNRLKEMTCRNLD
jgi:hypothetical protein